MTNRFFKFPSTKHLALLGELDIRNDKVMSAWQREEMLNAFLIVEEKIDGANLGISFDQQGELKTQNRGSYVSLSDKGQWKKLHDWITPRIDHLYEKIEDKYIVFGEWCYARHSVFYDKLPDWFLGFDIFDKKSERFVSTKHRHMLMGKMAISHVPVLAQGMFSLSDLRALLTTSNFGEECLEGLYIRRDSEDWLEQRAKLVRPGFVQSQNNHWTKKGIIPNQLSPEAYYN